MTPRSILLADPKEEDIVPVIMKVDVRIDRRESCDGGTEIQGCMTRDLDGVSYGSYLRWLVTSRLKFLLN